MSVSAPSVTTSLAIGAEASIAFDGVEFVANVAGSGGAFMLSAAGPIAGRFDGCTFLENAAAGKGGAMYLLNGAGALDVRDTLFESNRAGMGARYDLSPRSAAACEDSSKDNPDLALPPNALRTKMKVE